MPTTTWYRRAAFNHCWSYSDVQVTLSFKAYINWAFHFLKSISEIRLESTTKEQLEGSKRQIWLDSSIDDDVDDKSGKMPRGSMDFGGQISISVGCVNSTFNFSQFLEFCLGLTVQETTTLTATFSETITRSTGYATLTVGGCTPSGFPYPECRDFFITFPPLPIEPSTPQQPGTQPYMNE